MTVEEAFGPQGGRGEVIRDCDRTKWVAKGLLLKPRTRVTGRAKLSNFLFTTIDLCGTQAELCD